MSQRPMSDDDLRGQSADFRDICAAAVLSIALVLLIGHGVSPILELARAGDITASDVVRRLGRELAVAAPAIFYAFALWALRDAFARLAQGVRFEPALARGIGAAGRDLLWGAATAVLITPNILNATDGTPGGFEFDLDGAAVVIGFVGAALTLLAGLLSRAATQEAELREIV